MQPISRGDLRIARPQRDKFVGGHGTYRYGHRYPSRIETQARRHGAAKIQKKAGVITPLRTARMKTLDDSQKDCYTPPPQPLAA